MEPLKTVETKSGDPHSWAEPLRRVRLTDDPKVPLSGKNYVGHHLYEVNGQLCVFLNCDFSNAVLERCYFRGAQFVDCNFTGAKFYDCNFRSTEFSACRFDYVSIQRTHLPVLEILNNLPAYANVRRDLLQQLRANAGSVGDASRINLLVEKELEAERDYWRDARRRTSSYYQQKYGSVGKIAAAHWQSFRLWVDHTIWGHGESIIRLLVSTSIALFVLSIAHWVSESPGPVGEMTFGGLGAAMEATWRLYLDFPSATTGEGHIWTSLVLVLRYLSLGLFISVLFRKLSKR